MRKQLLTATALLWVCVVAWAAPVGREQAQKSAMEFLGKVSGMSQGKSMKLAARRPLLESAIGQDNACYYVFNVGEQDGFVIVSGDDRTPAIIGYANEGSFKSDELPQNMKAWLECYAEQIEWLGHQKASRHIMLNEDEQSEDHVGIAPLMATRWNQGSPYNDLCPIDPTTGEHSVTGCVATAMAQVLAYHRAPNRTVMPIPAFTTQTVGIAVAETSVTSIDWKNMLNVYKGNETNAQQTAVATLMKLCGASVQMDYSSKSSGASSYDIAPALRNYFGYASSTHRADRNNYRAAAWDALIYGELADGRPVLYCGQSAGGGHAFVVDGYDRDGLYHVNWGWGGQCDGYFLLSVLNPDNNEGIGASTSTDGYSYSQDALIGCTPNEGEAEGELPLMISYNLTVIGDKELTRNDEGNFVFSMQAQTYSGASDTQEFKIGIGIYDTAGEMVDGQSWWYVTLDPGWGWNALNLNDVEFGKELPDGVYEIALISGITDNENWYRNWRSDGVYIQARIEGDKCYLTEPTVDLRGTMTVDGRTEALLPVKITFDLTNYGTNFLEDVYLLVDGEPMGGMHLEIDAGKSETVTLEFTPETEGTKTVSLAYWSYGYQVLVEDEVTVEAAKEKQITCTSISISGLDEENVLRTNATTFTAEIENTGEGAYNDCVYLILFCQVDDSWKLYEYQRPTIRLEPGEKKMVSVDFEDLPDATRFNAEVQYRNNEGKAKYAGYTLSFTTDYTPESQPEPIKGDVNGDGVVDIADVVAIYNIMAGKQQ